MKISYHKKKVLQEALQGKSKKKWERACLPMTICQVQAELIIALFKDRVLCRINLVQRKILLFEKFTFRKILWLKSFAVFCSFVRLLFIKKRPAIRFFFYHGFLSQTLRIHETVGKRRGSSSFLSATSTCSRTFRHLFAYFHLYQYTLILTWVTFQGNSLILLCNLQK